MDIVELLEENNVRIWTRGNNVSKGWIGLNCPFCDDATNHLGIKLSDYRCRCWKCGKKSLQAVLQNVLDIPSQEARDYIKNLDPANLNKLLKEEVDPTIQKNDRWRNCDKVARRSNKSLPISPSTVFKKT
jgi:hypothetical protein